MTPRTYTTVLRHPSRTELVVATIPTPALAIYGGHREIGVRRVLERLEPFELVGVGEVGSFRAGPWGEVLEKMLPGFSEMVEPAEPSDRHRSWPTVSGWSAWPHTWDVLEWLTRLLSAHQAPDRQPDASTMVALFTDLEEGQVIVGEGTPVGRFSLGELIADGAIILALTHAVGPVAVVLAPAGVLLLRFARAAGDVIEDAVRRWTAE